MIDLRPDLSIALHCSMLYFRPNNPLVEVPESPSIVSGMKYNEWQRNSGLRVLRKVLDRQKLLQTSDLAGSTSTSAQVSSLSELRRSEF